MVPVETQIKNYIDSLPAPKQQDMWAIHHLILKLKPTVQLWFLDGLNSQKKVVANPNIGYDLLALLYANGSSKPFYKIGLSANSTGISVYVMGLPDKNFLKDQFAKKIGKAAITGYCIKFKSLKEINVAVLAEAIQHGLALPA
jgi:hypothetical protein